MALALGPVIGQIGGAGVEEIPVSMSGGGGTSTNPTVYPLATVDAGDGAVVLVSGTMDPASTGTPRPHLQIGPYTHESPHTLLTGPTGQGIGARVTGSVQIEVLSRTSGATTFTGTVYVARL